MATYAAYRHVELDNVGYGKKRVLKPPGGGSSDIFGATETGGSPRRTKTHMTQSSLGAALFDADVPDSKTTTTMMMMSNGNGSTPESPRAANGGSTTSINSNGSTGSSSHASTKPGGNPVTGAGYGGDSAQHQNGDSGSEKSSTDSSPGLTAVNRMRNRVPPGGYSSGLW